MKTSTAIDALAALAQEGRLELFRLLVRRLPGSVTPSELASVLNASPSLISAQLSVLARSGLVSRARQGKSLLYRAEIDRLDRLVRYLVEDCCKGRPEVAAITLPCCPSAASVPAERGAANGFMNVLFVCTGNCDLSLIAESLVRHQHAERFRSYSAGTIPSDRPDPAVLEFLKDRGHDVAQLRSKPLDAYLGEDTPTMDFVFTLCNRAANEASAPLPGGPITAHWNLPNPLVELERGANRAETLQRVLDVIDQRFAAFAALPFDALDRPSLQREVDAIALLSVPEAA